MLKKHNKHGPLKWFAGVLAAASLLTALPYAAPVYAAGDTGSSTAVQTAYTGFSAVSDIKVNNVSVKRYGHYSLSFNANGGTGSMKNYTDAELDDRFSLKNGFTRTGYDFIDWDTAKDGSGKNYEQSVTATADTFGAGDGANITLYAQWKPHTYKVVFHANSKDAKGEMGAQQMTYDETAVLHNVTFTREGYELAGWSTSAGSTDITYKNMVVVRNLTSEQGAEINLYAVWHGPVADAAKISIDSLSHQHTFVWKSDYEGHWQECTVCGYKTAKESHAAYDEKTVIGDLSKCGNENYIYNHCTKCGRTWHSHEGQKKHNPFVTTGAKYNIVDIRNLKDGSWAYKFNWQRHDLYCVDCNDEIDAEAWNGTGELSEEYLHDERYDIPGLRERIQETGPLPRYHVHNGKIIGGSYGAGTCDICGATIPDTIWGEYWWSTDDLDIYPNNSGQNGTDAWGKIQIFDVDHQKHTYKRNADGTITATFVMPYLPNVTSMTMGNTWWIYNHAYPLISADGVLDKSAKTITLTFVYKPTDNNSANCGRDLVLTTSDGKTYTMATRFQLRGDITAPTVNANVTSASQKNGWQNNITLNLEGTEDVTGSVYIWVRTSDSKKAWLISRHEEAVTNNKWSYSTALNVSADAAGKDLIITVVDGNWNETTITKHIEKIDTAPPQLMTKVDYSGDANWTKERTVTVHATDGDGSGNVKDGSIEIALNNHGDYQKGTNTGKDFTRTYVFAGDKYNDDPYVIFLRDPAGNESQTGINIGRIDNSIPTIQSAPVDGRSVTVTASDYVDGYGEGSGVTTYGYIDVSSKDTSVHKQTSNVITLPHDGEFLIVVYDKVGNMSEPFTVRAGNVSAGAKKVTFFDTGEMN